MQNKGNEIVQQKGQRSNNGTASLKYFKMICTCRQKYNQYNITDTIIWNDEKYCNNVEINYCFSYDY